MLPTLRNLGLALGAALGTMLVAPAAHAQDKGGDFGEQGEFIFGADRLFSVFAYTSNIYSLPGQTGNTTSNGTEMGLFWGGNGVAGGTGGGVFAAGNPNFYSPPRLGFDYTVIPHLTIGGELYAWFTPGQNNTTPTGNGTSTTNPSPTGSAFGIAPRVGYIFGMSDMLSIWLRGGVSYYVSNWNSNAPNGCSASASLDAFGLDIDPQLVISPVRHFAFTVGPSLDWGFLGGWSYQGTCNAATTSGNYNAVNFSVNGGLLGWF
jgi:hypothetical protein